MIILIAAINARFTHSSLAIRYLRQAIEDGWQKQGPDQSDDHQIRLREFQINQPRMQILELMVLNKPDVLLLSVSIWSSLLVQTLLADIRALLPACRIILGGPEVSWQAEAWVARFPAIDLIVQGAGEGAICFLAEHNFDLDALRTRFSGPEKRLLAMVPPEFSTQAYPWRDEDFAELANRYVYHETSRGCPFACAYCLSAREDQPLQMKSAEIACYELGRLLEQRPMLVKLVDRTFNADPSRARQIWQFLINHDNGFSLFHFEIHPALLEEPDFSLLTKVREGLFQFEIGVQSVNPKALAAINRQVDWPSARSAIARIIAIGTVRIHLDLIIGLPNEGMAEIGWSFDEILALKPQHFQLGFLKVLPGSPIEKQVASLALIHQASAPYEILSSRWLSPRDLSQIRVIDALLEASWNAGIGQDRLEQGARMSGGAWNFFGKLAKRVADTGYDVRTRQASKVLEFLDGGLKELPDAPPA